MRIFRVTLVAIALVGVLRTSAFACTGFCAKSPRGQVLVGNNEDWDNPRTRLWFVPATADTFGRLYVGFDDLWPQGGMNERGLWFDGFATPAVRAAGSAELPHFRGNLVDEAMATCATVDEVVHLIERYNRSFLTEGTLMFADASGDAASIEANAIVRKGDRAHFVQTNFLQSRGGRPDARFTTATSMLDRAGGDISVDLFRRILAATHQEGPSPTQYSNVYDLSSRTMYLYYFHEYDHVVTVRLEDELGKGPHVLDIPRLFPASAAATAYAATRPAAAEPPPWTIVALTFVLGLALAATLLYVVVRAGRRGRVAFAAASAVAVGVAALAGLALRGHGPASTDWIQFSISPATGRSLGVNDTMIRGDGASILRMLSIAYEMPESRIVAPGWAAEARYTVNALVGLDDAAQLHTLLREELIRHLHLETHVETRPFDLFVLGTTAAPHLERADPHDPAIRIGERSMQCRNTSMTMLADVLQTVLGRPIVDETRLAGAYNLEFGWEEQSPASIGAVLRDRFGLTLTPGRRDLDALVVDRMRRDPALFLLGHAGAVIRSVPLFARRRVASALAVD